MFSKKDDKIILTITRKECDMILLCFGMAIFTQIEKKDLSFASAIIKNLNNIMDGNPDYMPYEFDDDQKPN